MHDKKTIKKLKRELKDKVDSIHKRLEYVAPKLNKKDIRVTDLELGSFLQEIGPKEGPDFEFEDPYLCKPGAELFSKSACQDKADKILDEAFRTAKELKDEFGI